MSRVIVEHARVVPYSLDLGGALETARGPLDVRQGFLVLLDSACGRVGRGDAAAFVGFGSSEAAIAARLREWLPVELGRSSARRGRVQFDSTDAIERWLDGHPNLEPEVRAALELAMLDLLGQKVGVPIAILLDPNAERFARTHLLVSQLGPSLGRSGARTFKLKIGGDLERDERKVGELRALIGDATIRLDAGGGYGVREARRAILRFARYEVALVEQPIARGSLGALAVLRQLAEAHGMRIAVDEDVRDGPSLARVIAHEAAHAVVIKPMFAGGLLRARRLALQARAAGLEAIITHALESAIGRAGALHLAATLPGVHGLCWQPATDLASLPERVGELIPLPRGVGLGLAAAREEAGPEATASSQLGQAAHELAVPPAIPRSAITPPAHDLAVPNPIASSAIERPAHPALVFEHHEVDYGTLRCRVARAAASLRKRGVHAGMNIVLEGPVDCAWIEWFHAIGWAGATVCPMPRKSTSAERRQLLRAFSPDLIIDSSMPIEDDIASSAERFWPLDEVRLRIATSGTSGQPRAVSLTTGQLVLSALSSSMRIGHDPSDRWLCALPLYHIGGAMILVRAALAGTTVVLHDRFDPERVARELDSARVNLASLTPTMLARVLDARPARPFPPSLRALLTGGGPADEALLARCRELEAPVALSWGMTEAASQLATRAPGDLGPLEAGLPPLGFARVSARGDRLVVRGPLVAGELATMDRGTVRADGRVQLLGRCDTIIVHGGENIDPVEVETVLLAHPAVAEAAVYGVACARYGKSVHAALVARASCARPSDDELIRHCRRRLVGFKVPSRFAWRDSLPRTAMGKLLRLALEQADAAEANEQGSGSGAHADAVERDEGVHELRCRAHIVAPPLTTQDVAEGERVSASTLDSHFDVDAIVQADRPHEISLGVNERHPDPLLFEQLHDVAIGGEQQLLEGSVAHLEHPPEKQNSGPIHFVETRSDPMNERHDHERRL